MTSEYLLNYPALGNKDLLVNSITYGKTKIDTVSIDTIFLNDTSLSLTAAQLQMNKIILVLLVPLGIIIAGFVVWQYRRKK